MIICPSMTLIPGRQGRSAPLGVAAYQDLSQVNGEGVVPVHRLQHTILETFNNCRSGIKARHRGPSLDDTDSIHQPAKTYLAIE